MTEFGLRIDVRQGRFRVRVDDFDFEEAEASSQDAELRVRKRTYEFMPKGDDDSTMWLFETTDSKQIRPGSSVLASQYPRFSKEWTEALSEWEKLGPEHAQRHRFSLKKGPNKPEPDSNKRWSSWVFQGGMLACWLALQYDVQYVSYGLWNLQVGKITHTNAADELQVFLQAYPWAKEGVEAS